MEKFKKLTSDLTAYGFFWIFLNSLFSLGVFLTGWLVLNLSPKLALIICIVVIFGVSIFVARLIALAATQPLRAVWQAVWHVSPSGNRVPAPVLDQITHGREVVEALNNEIYNLASAASQIAPSNQPANLTAENPQPLPSHLNFGAPAPDKLLEVLPVPIIALDKQGLVIAANKMAGDFIGKPVYELLNKPFSDNFHLSFLSTETLESWLTTSANNSVSATNTWERVKLPRNDQSSVKQFDMAAHYNRDNPSGYETLLAFFDRTNKYLHEDSSTSYVALAVHELRTPLTVLRGYIEVFEDELEGKLTPEMIGFMHKMSAAAQTLTAFVSNILNVARVDENQLNLSLVEADWPELLAGICKDLELRTKVRGKRLELDIAPNLPSVAVDKISIYEVVSNLVDNAVKYSVSSDRILIHTCLGQDGSVETVVQDFGVGIPESALKNLFTKYYRSHRSSGRVGGSGLGLYLVKAIVTAHGGHVWVSSHEGEGSSFGFSLQPFSAVKDELDSDGRGIERQAHGWIKNHSIYRK